MDSFLNMIWAISAGLLSLTGVIGIFIALSIQQKIDKSREILWELILPPTDLFEGEGRDSILNTAHYINQRYFLYKHLEETEGMGAVRPAVTVLNSLLLIVSLFWITGLYILWINGSGFEHWCYMAISGGLIYLVLVYGLWEVYKLFKGLFSARELDELPKAKDLLDVSNKSNKIHILKFVTNSISLAVKVDEEENILFLRIAFVLPFYNFFVEPEIIFYRGQEQKLIKRLPQKKLVELKGLDEDETTIEAKDNNGKGSMDISYKIDLSAVNRNNVDCMKISIHIEDDNENKIDVIARGDIALKGRGWIIPDLYLMEWMTQEELKKIDWNGDKSIKC